MLKITANHFSNNLLDIESQLIVDPKHDHYQLLDVGWEGMKRVYSCIMQFGYQEWQDLDSAQYDRR